MKSIYAIANETISNFDGSTGYRVADVVNEAFDVALPLFWSDCDDECVSDLWYFKAEIGKCVPKPIEPEQSE